MPGYAAKRADDVADAIPAVARLPERAVVPVMQILPTYLQGYLSFARICLRHLI
jgi:hypothetical protein